MKIQSKFEALKCVHWNAYSTWVRFLVSEHGDFGISLIQHF